MMMKRWPIWAGVFARVPAKNSKSVPEFTGPTTVNGLKELSITGLTFGDNPEIKTDLIYVLNRGYAVCFMCTFHSTNQTAGQKYCVETAGSLAFTNPPVLRPKYAFLGPIAGKISSNYMAFNAPSGWQVMELKNATEEPAGGLIQEFILSENSAQNARLTLARTPFGPGPKAAEAVKSNFIRETKQLASLLGYGDLSTGERFIGGYHTTWLAGQDPAGRRAENILLAVLIPSGDSLFSATLLAKNGEESSKAHYTKVLENLIGSLELLENIRLLSTYQESRLLDSAAFNLLAPRKWFILPPSLSPDTVNKMPAAVARQYNGTSSALSQLIDPATPEKNINSININVAPQPMIFTDESTKNLENQLAAALGKNYKNVKMLDAQIGEISGAPAFYSYWQSELDGGVLLYTLQTLVACRENTIIATCLFTGYDMEQVKQNCLDTVSTVRCK